MSNIEIILIIIACLVPVVAFVIILPKHIIKKAKKKPEPKVEPYVPTAKEEKPAAAPQPTGPIEDYKSDEFKSYFDRRKENLSKPKRNEFDPLRMPPTQGYFPRRPMPFNTKKPQTLCEEIQNLSPELKALIFSGALNKQDYDEE